MRPAQNDPLAHLVKGRSMRSMFNFFSGRSDVILDAQRPDALLVLLAALREHDREWDTIQIEWLPTDSPLYQHLAHADLGSMSVYATKSSESPYIEMEGKDFETYYTAESSSKTRSKERRYLRNAAAKGF